MTKTIKAPAIVTTPTVADTLTLSKVEKTALVKSIASMGAGYKTMADTLTALENGDNLFYPISKWVEVLGVELSDKAKNALKNALQFERSARINAGYTAPAWYRGSMGTKGAKPPAKLSEKKTVKGFTAPDTTVDPLSVSVSIADAWLAMLVKGSKVSPDALVSQLKRCEPDFFVAVKALIKSATLGA